MLRLTGLAYSPGVAGLLMFIPVLGGLLVLAAGIWDMVVGVVAVRTALDFDTGKAIATVVLAFVVTVVIVAIITGLLLAAIAGAR
jgi:uncharacterized membrane protein YjjB (DUF3815 family)